MVEIFIWEFKKKKLRKEKQGIKRNEKKKSEQMSKWIACHQFNRQIIMMNQPNFSPGEEEKKKI